MANNAQAPSGFAAATKVVVDSIKTTFGAAVVVLFFFGLSLVVLVSGKGELEPPIRADIIYLLIWAMLGILGVLFVLRILKPDSLGGPPQPETEAVSFTNSTLD